MAGVPGDLDTDSGPPMAIPLRHFVVGFGFLLAGAAVGLFAATGIAPAGARLAHVHLLLAGWICVTIMGAMTQFVPVWSGVPLYSRRLASAQLWFVTAGVAGMAAAFAAGAPEWLVPSGGLALAGFWTFVYGVGRTLARARPLDVTERHFALALGYFLVVTVLGFALAVDLVHPVLGPLGVPRANAVAAHATLAVFGAVLTTVLGALYQLATMFTGTELRGIDGPLSRIEAAGYPAGVVALATGRLWEVPALARAGGLLVVVALLAFAVVLARRLHESSVERTPMHSRYAVASVTTAAWSLLAASAWLRDPLAADATLGAPGTAHLLALGVVGVVVIGTLYHVVPFVVWVHRYSDRLGYEPVPMVDDLYHGGVAAADFAAVVGGGVLLVVAGALPRSHALRVTGGALVAAGAVLFVGNMALVLRRHAPESVAELLVGQRARGDASSADSSERDASPDDRTADGVATDGRTPPDGATTDGGDADR